GIRSALKNPGGAHVDPGTHLVRFGDRLRWAHVLRRHLVHAGQARQAHGADQLVLEDLEHTHAPGDATGGQAPALQAAERYHVRAERDRLQDVAPALHATIDDDARAAGDGLDNLGQRLQAAEAVIDLASAMVRCPAAVD